MQKWEYYYLSNAECRARVTEKVGRPTFKSLFGRDQRTEYHKNCEKVIHEILNELGDEGWELVSGGTKGVAMIFKREKR